MSTGTLERPRAASRRGGGRDSTYTIDLVLLTVVDGEHLFGGISGEGAKDTTDEDPDRVVLVADAVSAYLHDVLSDDERSWPALQDRISHSTGAFSTESK